MPLSGHHDIALDVVNDVESIRRLIITSSFKSEPACKLINRIPGLRLLISQINKVSILKALPGKLYIKRHHPVFSIYHTTREVLNGHMDDQ